MVGLSMDIFPRDGDIKEGGGSLPESSGGEIHRGGDLWAGY